MDIPTTQEILLFGIMLCATILFFGTIYVIELFIDSLCFLLKVCRDYFKIFLPEMENILLKEVADMVVILFEIVYFVLAIYSLPFNFAIFFKQHSVL